MSSFFVNFTFAAGDPVPAGGLAPALAGSVGVGGTPRGLALFAACRPCLPPSFCPHPPTPFPAGRGRFLAFLCKGLRPLHPRGWMGRSTGSTCVSATRRGGLPSLPPAAHAFSFDSAPYPPSPRSQSDLPRRGRGRFLVFLCKGLRPLHPRGWMGRGTGSTCVSATPRGACPLCRTSSLPSPSFLPPSPRPPSRREGGDF